MTHFTSSEYQHRRQKVIAALQQQALDGILIFQQESMYYLTGYDSFGHCFFQCLYLGSDDQFFLLTRAPDLRQARHTSVIDDIRVWVDLHDTDPCRQLAVVLQEYGCNGASLGIEMDAATLTGHRWEQLKLATGFCRLTPCNELVTHIRAIKSRAELAFVYRAAELADDALHAAITHTRPGKFEGEILAEMQSAVFRGGGDYAGNEFIIGSGAGALLCRYFSGRRHLESEDQLTIEFAGAYRHYHACLMRTLIIGKTDQKHLQMYQACQSALLACQECIQPGTRLGAIFEAHASVMDAHGYAKDRLNACGYSLGASFSPCWMDPPMIYRNNPFLIKAGMVLFLHMILMNSEDGRAMTLGETVVVTGQGCERLSHHSLDLIQIP